MDTTSTLISSLEDCRVWFAKHYQVCSPLYPFSMVDRTPDDWIMRVNLETRVTEFNPYLLDPEEGSPRSTFWYFESILIHELFHLDVQNLPNKDDARRVMRTLGFSRMGFFDVEADVATARFLRGVRGLTLIEYLRLIYEGTLIFGDPTVHLSKVNRFLGTLISVCRMYLRSPEEEPCVYLPCLETLMESSRDGGALAQVFMRQNHALTTMPIDMDDYFALREVYTNQGELSEYGCLHKIIEISFKALSEPIPAWLESDLRALRPLRAVN